MNRTKNELNTNENGAAAAGTGSKKQKKNNTKEEKNIQTDIDNVLDDLTDDMCSWESCDTGPKNIKTYTLTENSRIATNIGADGEYYCTIVGNKPLIRNKVISWHIKILTSKENDGRGIFIGVAPSDIDRNERINYTKCGWYFDCYRSSLWSGPPHNYWNREYGLRKTKGHYVHPGGSVGVVMDTIKGELSAVFDGKDYGVAYKGIPFDKPIAPCVILRNQGDSIELNLSDPSFSIPTPSNVTAKCGDTWDSITISWDAVEGAAFYQVETLDNKWRYGTLTNTFTATGLWPETKHDFRVRAVNGSLASRWSDIISLKTSGKPSISEYAWKVCPEYVTEERKYSVNEKNVRIATKCHNSGGSEEYSVVMCNVFLLAGRMTSWNIKIVKSKNNDGNGMYVGVAPWDIYQRVDYEQKYVYNRCGWYLDCYRMTLRSGAPHYYCGEKKDGMVAAGTTKKDGEYVRTGDRVGVVMDNKSGTLSFALNEVNLGVAYEGIPLDKPLVPCVLLGNEGDSVEILF